MDLKVGDKILLIRTTSKWNGRRAEAIYQGEVVNLDLERVKIRLPKGEIEVPFDQIARIEILEAKKSIFQRILGKLLIVISFIMEAVATVFNRAALVISFIMEAVATVFNLALGVLFLAGVWIKDRFKRFKRR